MIEYLLYRYRGQPPARQPAPPASGAEDKSFVKRPLIIKDQDLKEFDKIEENDGGWAGAHGEIDYRLVISLFINIPCLFNHYVMVTG